MFCSFVGIGLNSILDGESSYSQDSDNSSSGYKQNKIKDDEDLRVKQEILLRHTQKVKLCKNFFEVVLYNAFFDNKKPSKLMMKANQEIDYEKFIDFLQKNEIA